MGSLLDLAMTAAAPVQTCPRVATKAQAAELSRLVDLAYGNHPDKPEALAVALADPDAALRCFRAITAHNPDRRNHERCRSDQL